MRHRRTTNENKMLSKMENMISMMASEKPFERIQSLEQKINEIDKIHVLELCNFQEHGFYRSR